LKFDMPDPGAAIEAGLKPDITPDGKLLTESATAELNEPVAAVVTTTVPLYPGVRDSEPDGTEMLKLAADDVPVPLSDTDCGEPVALSATESVAEKLDAEAGVKVT
jgi:hypothetical protein